jgi:hypothetical protein
MTGKQEVEGRAGFAELPPDCQPFRSSRVRENQ